MLGRACQQSLLSLKHNFFNFQFTYGFSADSAAQLLELLLYLTAKIFTIKFSHNTAKI